MARKKKEIIEENFLNETLDDIMSDRFGSYSKYIIQERALPDARDGLWEHSILMVILLFMKH